MDNTTLHMADFHNYVVGARVAGSLVTLIGIFTNGLVLIYAEKKNDHMNYVILMKIYSLINILRLIAGWIGSMRIHARSNYNIFFIYGIGSYLPHYASFIIDTVGFLLIESSVILVPICMAFRCSILFDRKPTAIHVYLAVMLSFLMALPAAAAVIIGYAEGDEARVHLDGNVLLLEEADLVPYYVVSFKYTWQKWITLVGLSLSVPSTPITLILRWVMQRHLRLYKKGLSASTRNLHRNFIKLLTLDSTLPLIGSIVFLIRAVIIYKVFADIETLMLLSYYNFAIFALIPVIQGCATLYYVSYLKEKVKSFFVKRDRHGDNHSVSMASIDPNKY